MFKYIINSLTNEKIDIFSNQGKKYLKLLTNTFQKGGAEEEEEEEEEKEEEKAEATPRVRREEMERKRTPEYRIKKMYEKKREKYNIILRAVTNRKKKPKLTDVEKQNLDVILERLEQWNKLLRGNETLMINDLKKQIDHRDI